MHSSSHLMHHVGDTHWSWCSVGPPTILGALWKCLSFIDLLLFSFFCFSFLHLFMQLCKIHFCMHTFCFSLIDSLTHSPMFLSSLAAYWDATRACMILSLLACFIGIIIGIMAFIHYSSFDRFDKTFAAGVLFFISCEWLPLSATQLRNKGVCCQGNSFLLKKYRIFLK